MSETKQWLRPQDVPTRRTSDPKEMLGKYLPKRVVKTWMEDFSDEDTGEVVSIERNEVIHEPGYINQNVLQELTFALQAGDIKDVEICDEAMVPAQLAKMIVRPFLVEMSQGLDQKKIIVRAITIPQAIEIAIDYASVYLGMGGNIYVDKVTPVKGEVLSDHDECIPESEWKEETEEKDYFRVTVRMRWVENQKLKVEKIDYILPANDVGEAKERMSRKIDIAKKTNPVSFSKNGDDTEITVHKAVPFDVDFIVPKDYTLMYLTDEEKVLYNIDGV